MAVIDNVICKSWLLHRLNADGNMDAGGDAMRTSLHQVGPPDVGVDTPSYPSVAGSECTGTGYTIGGAPVIGQQTSQPAGAGAQKALFDITTYPTWANVSLDQPADGFLLHFTIVQSSAAIACWKFTAPQQPTAVDFTLVMPAVGSGTSLLRLA